MGHARWRDWSGTGNDKGHGISKFIPDGLGGTRINPGWCKIHNLGYFRPKKKFRRYYKASGHEKPFFAPNAPEFQDYAFTESDF